MPLDQAANVSVTSVFLLYGPCPHVAVPVAVTAAAAAAADSGAAADAG